MAIQRWDPLHDLLRLKQSINRMFEETLSRSAIGDVDAPSAAAWSPPVDLCEEPERYVLRVDLPGVDSSQVDVRVEGERLVVRGQRRTDGEAGREAYLRMERPSGPFTLQLALPPSVDGDQIRAVQRNGVLEVTLPKRREAPPGRIQVSGE